MRQRTCADAVVYVQAFDEFAPRLVLLSDQCDAALREAVLGRGAHIHVCGSVLDAHHQRASAANGVGIKVQTCALVDFDAQFLKSCLKELGLVDHHFDYIAGSSISLEGLQKFPLAVRCTACVLARLEKGAEAIEDIFKRHRSCRHFCRTSLA